MQRGNESPAQLAKWKAERLKTIKVQRKRANTALPALLKKFPPADQIGPREWKWIENRKPRQDDIVDAEKDLAVDIARYDDLRKRGGDAVSDFDLTISSGHDGVAALAGALKFKVAHISYNRGRLAWLKEKLGVQASIF